MSRNSGTDGGKGRRARSTNSSGRVSWARARKQEGSFARSPTLWLLCHGWRYEEQELEGEERDAMQPAIMGHTGGRRISPRTARRSTSKTEKPRHCSSRRRQRATICQQLPNGPGARPPIPRRAQGRGTLGTQGCLSVGNRRHEARLASVWKNAARASRIASMGVYWQHPASNSTMAPSPPSLGPTGDDYLYETHMTSWKTACACKH